VNGAESGDPAAAPRRGRIVKLATLSPSSACGANATGTVAEAARPGS
jgi:hypothetical protein